MVGNGYTTPVTLLIDNSTPEIRVGEPVHYESLSVFPLFSGVESPVEYLLSDEGIGSWRDR